MSAMISNAQNREDVVLWRALKHVREGRYVEVGANHPTVDSVSRVFYDHGWSGITVEPVPHFAALHREARPRDVLVEAAATDSDGDSITLHVVPDTGLSTTVDSVSDHHAEVGIEHEDITVPTTTLDALLAREGLQDRDIHFLLVDVEGAEASVLRGLDLSVWRPWVLVIESTAPNSTEQTHHQWEAGVLAAGYEYCLFDGLSRYYVSSEHADELRADLSYPASVWDDYTTPATRQLQDTNADLNVQVVELSGQVNHWRSLALSHWADAVSRDMRQQKQIARMQTQVKKLRTEIRQLRASTSWRVTKPLRKASSAVGRR